MTTPNLYLSCHLTYSGKIAYTVILDGMPLMADTDSYERALQVAKQTAAKTGKPCYAWVCRGEPGWFSDEPL